MTTEEIKTSLRQLHAELAQGHAVDPEVTSLLQVLEKDIHSLLEQPRSEAANAHPAMADRLNLEIRQLKTSLEERGFPEPKLTVLAPRATEPAAWVSVGREVVSDPAPSPQANTDRRTSDDERRDRWAANRDQRRDGQRHQEHPRQPRRDHHGEPK